MLSIKQWLDMMSNPATVKAFAGEPLVLQGHYLTYPDKRRIYDAYLKWMLVISDLAAQLDEAGLGRCANQWSRTYSPRNLTKIFVALSSLDVDEVHAQKKALLLALRHLSVTKGIQEKSENQLFEEFGVVRNHTVIQFLLPLYRFVASSENVQAYRYLNTILQFDTRLTLKDVDWIEDEELDSYISFEEDLKRQSYDLQIISELRSVIRDWFHDFKIIEAIPDHGYGATAGVKRSRGTTEKYFDFVPYRESAYLAYRLGWDPGLHCYPAISYLLHDSLLRAEDEIGPLATVNTQRMRYNLVPKGINKKRGVSMEPTSHMFFQKMLSQCFDQHFQRKKFMGIDLHDQERSRTLCLQASLRNHYGTIDLSSASDSVTLSLVKAIFRDEEILPLILMCRTSSCCLQRRNNEEHVQLEKFAPMGSALCFPIECVIFAAICEVASRRKGLYNKQQFVVYGDDIIASRKIFDEVILLLHKLNFLVNTDKTYAPEYDFKEACGMESYLGFDVSPLRMSRKWDIESLRRAKTDAIKAKRASATLAKVKKTKARSARAQKAKAKAIAKAKGQLKAARSQTTILNAAYDAANDAFLYGCKTLRNYIIQQTLDVYPGAVFSETGETGFLSFSSTLNNHLECRMDPDLQEPFVKIQKVTSRISRGVDIVRYSTVLEKYDYTKRSALMDPKDLIDVHCGAARSYTIWTWVPAYTLVN